MITEKSSGFLTRKIRPARSKPLPWFLAVLAIAAVSASKAISTVEVHDIATGTPPGPEEVKCGCSTCANPCYYLQPPPPPPSPPPTDPYQTFCPPPPQLQLEILDPPEALYPLDPAYPSASPRSMVARLPVLIGYGLLGLLWRL